VGGVVGGGGYIIPFPSQHAMEEGEMGTGGGGDTALQGVHVRRKKFKGIRRVWFRIKGLKYKEGERR
jgi:hypothetical protein